MITEDYCSYELSKLLKEKGFDWMCNGYYNKDDEYSEPYFGDGEGADNWNNQAPSVKDLWCSAPTHQMAMKWLREVYNVHIVIEYYEADGEGFYGWIVKTGSERYHCHQEFSITYEEAVDAAIKYSLENLI